MTPSYVGKDLSLLTTTVFDDKRLSFQLTHLDAGDVRTKYGEDYTKEIYDQDEPDFSGFSLA